MQPAYWRSKWKKASILRRLSGVTLIRSRAEACALMWADSCAETLSESCAEASPASRGATPVRGVELRMIEIYGLQALARLRSINQALCFWRTSPGFSALAEWIASARTCEQWATAARSAYGARKRLARATAESGPLLWGSPTLGTNNGVGQLEPTRGSRLADQSTAWMTPKVARGTWEYRGGGKRKIPTLAGEAANWSSPTTHDGRRPGADLLSTQNANLSREAATWDWPTPNANPEAPNNGTRRENGRIAARLTNQCLAQIARDWPTPTGRVSNDGENPETWHSRRRTLALKGIHGNVDGEPLTVAAVEWATPNMDDSIRRHVEPDGKRGIQLPTQAKAFPLRATMEQGSLFTLPPETTIEAGATSSTVDPGLCPRSATRKLNPFFVEFLMGWFPGTTSGSIDLGWEGTEWILYKRRLRSCLCSLVCGEGSDG